MSSRKPIPESRGWTQYWIRNAHRVADRRRQRYGLEPPRRIGRLLRAKDAHIGFVNSLRLAFYSLFGSPSQMIQLAWRYLTDRDTPRRKARIETLATELRTRISPASRIVVGYFERCLYSRDLARVPHLLEKILHRTTPQLVVQPKKEADVVALMKFAARHRMPVFPRGISSSAFGGAVPTLNGITLDLSSLTGIFEVDLSRRTVRCAAGVRWADLAEHLRDFGLAPMATPSSRFSTVGGWASTGGLGIESFGYGHFAEAIDAARAVLPNGELLECRAGDENLADFIGTEGQFGILTELTLRLKPLPAIDAPVLLPFDDAGAAFDFLDRLVASSLRPSHVAYYDSARLEEENLAFRDRTGLKDSVVPKTDAVLLHFDDPEQEQKFHEVRKSWGARDTAEDSAAHYLWAERYFPMKFQRLGPSMLAAEVLLSRHQVPAFIECGRRLARRFGSTLAVEVFVSRIRPDAFSSEDRDCVVLASFRCDARRRLDYFLRLLLAQLLVHLGVRIGGRPYGFGIWNSPFLHRGVPRPARKRLASRKLKVDPHLLLNPMKFFRVRTRLFNLPGILFLSPVYGFWLGTMRLFSPLVGLLARWTRTKPEETWTVPSPKEEGGKRLLRETALRCTFCGACVSTCPAYLLTGDERSTARGKLRLSETLSASGEISREDAASPFRCLHCGLCEEVCQSGLPLTDCYAALEGWVEKEFGKPHETIETFASLLDANREWLLKTFGLHRAEWTP
ncbi:MAG: FAD-binding oxidoreductase, partial [Planctomycetota bacterium]